MATMDEVMANDDRTAAGDADDAGVGAGPASSAGAAVVTYATVDTTVDEPHQLRLSALGYMVHRSTLVPGGAGVYDNTDHNGLLCYACPGAPHLHVHNPHSCGAQCGVEWDEVPLDRTMVNDEQMAEVCWRHPNIPTCGRYPLNLHVDGCEITSLWHLLQQMVVGAPTVTNGAATDADAALSRSRFTRMLLSSVGLQRLDASTHATGVLPVVGGGHWRTILFDQREKTAYLCDSFGKDGWQSGRAGQCRDMLVRLAQTHGFSVEIMDFVVQRDVYQCGVWVLYFCELFGTYLLHRSGIAPAAGCDPSLGWIPFATKALRAHGVVSGPDADCNAGFIAGKRREFSAGWCTNPRMDPDVPLVGEPAVGAYSPGLWTLTPEHFAPNNTSYPYKFVAAQWSWGFPVDLQWKAIRDVPQGAEVPCGRLGCRHHWQGECSLLGTPDETLAGQAEISRQLARQEFAANAVANAVGALPPAPTGSVGLCLRVCLCNQAPAWYVIYSPCPAAAVYIGARRGTGSTYRFHGLGRRRRACCSS
jgi:hypothetical protein